MVAKNPCTVAEYQFVLHSLESCRSTLEKALANPGIPRNRRLAERMQASAQRHEVFLSTHEPVEGYVPTDRPYISDGGDGCWNICGCDDGSLTSTK